MTANMTPIPTEQWKLKFTLDEGVEACGQDDCTLGLYNLETKREPGMRMDSFSPACTTCEFAGGLGDVFNPDDQSYIEGAPECYKRAAAFIISQESGRLTLTLLRAARPDTADMIISYANEEQPK